MAKKKHWHEKLRITFRELGALLGTRNMLAANLLEHDGQYHSDADDSHRFDMSTQCKVNGCGTISCIGGTMAFIMGIDEIDYVGTGFTHGNHSPVLRSLFFPTDLPMSVDNWHKITPAQAVKAIDNFLNTGKPNWVEAFKD